MIQFQLRIRKTLKSVLIETDLFEREDANTIEKQLAEILENTLIEVMKDLCKQVNFKVRMKRIKKI